MVYRPSTCPPFEWAIQLVWQIGQGRRDFDGKQKRRFYKRNYNTPVMKKTALFDQHVNGGARMEEFGGFEMPIQFTRIHEEHMAVRKKAGIFDVSHMGEMIIEGKGAVRFLEKITTNHAGKIKVGQAQYTLMTNPEGGIIDDFLLYRLREDRFMMVVNAGNTDKDWDWIIENKSFDTRTENISSTGGIIAVQGPRASGILSK